MGVVVLCKCRHIYVVEATKMHMWKQIYGKQPFCSYHCWQKIRGLPFSKACKSETITVNGDFNHTTNHNAALWNTKAFLLTTHLHLFIGLLCQTTAPAAQREGRRQIVSVCQVPLTAFNQRCCRYIAHVQLIFFSWFWHDSPQWMHKCCHEVRVESVLSLAALSIISVQSSPWNRLYLQGALTWGDKALCCSVWAHALFNNGPF